MTVKYIYSIANWYLSYICISIIYIYGIIIVYIEQMKITNK